MIYFKYPKIIIIFFFRIFNLDYFQVIILLKYIEGMYLDIEEKRKDIVFVFSWRVVRNA